VFAGEGGGFLGRAIPDGERDTWGLGEACGHGAPDGTETEKSDGGHADR
jgi:hypothetical protein